MEVNEYRVRPVNRFVLTHYHSDGLGGAVRTIGEFANADAANEVAQAMRKTAPNLSGPVHYPLPPAEPDGVEYVIVGNSLGDEATIAHYAYSEVEAAARKEQCEAKFGGTFNVFTRKRG
jgi:hypothetical protein